MRGRSAPYGQILIIEHGGGYHTVLAGLEGADAVVGQWLLAGEPVGVVGSPDSGRPQLYLELRRDGQPIDPALVRAQRHQSRQQQRSMIPMFRTYLLAATALAAGMAMALVIAFHPTLVSAQSASATPATSSSTYEQLNLFGEVFERIRAGSPSRSRTTS